MKYYITAFDAEDKQILGNLDGQAALLGIVRPERTHAWRFLQTARKMRRRVKFWQLETEHGRVVAVQYNRHWEEGK